MHVRVNSVIGAATAVTLLVFASSVFAAPKPHTPSFTWKVLGGSVNPEQWIYDGDIPLAMFEQRIIEQPGENLMFFNGIPKPPLLRHVRLSPGGPPLVEGIQLYWKLATNHATDQVVKIDVEGRGTPRLVVTFHTRDRNGVADAKRVLTLTYDETSGSYIYDFQAWITLNGAEFFNGGTVSLEYVDPWFTECPGPAVEFPGMWGRRYTRFVYEAKDGVMTIPINHFTTSHKGGIKLRPDGMFVLAHEPDGNPAIQLVGDTADQSSIGICWWGYDIHCGLSIAPEEFGKPVLARFRITDCPPEKAERMVREGKVPPMKPSGWGLGNEYPVYERISGFSKGIALDGVFDGPVDPFPWSTAGAGASWDKTGGRTDTPCLKISKTEPGLTRWQTFQGDGEGYFTEPWSWYSGYRVSCWVKTEAVTGRGSTLALQYHLPNMTQEFSVSNAKRLTGTNGWTKLELEVGQPPENSGALMIMLQQDGAGTTWFDDLEVTPLKE